MVRRVKGPITEGAFRRPVQLQKRRWRPARLKSPWSTPDALDAAGLDHGLGPSGAMRAQPIRNSAQEPRCARSAPVIFSAAMYWDGVLEAARFLPGVHRNLLHSLVEDPDHAAVPAPHPNLPRPGTSGGTE